MDHSAACRIDIAKSRYLLSYLIFVYTMMAVTLSLLLSYSFWLMAILLACLAISLCFQLKQFGWMKGDVMIKKITCDEQGLWTLYFSGKHAVSNLELKSSFVSPFLTLIRLKGSQLLQTTTVVIISDAVNVEQFRQLRVMLRAPKAFQK